MGVNWNSVQSFGRRVERGIVEGTKDVIDGYAGSTRSLLAVGAGCAAGAKAAGKMTVYEGNAAWQKDPVKMATGCAVGAFGTYEVLATVNPYSFSRGFQRGWNESQ